MAGFVCNVVNAGLIPTTALLSWAFFGEVLTQVEIFGAALVFGAILVLTLAKFHGIKTVQPKDNYDDDVKKTPLLQSD